MNKRILFTGLALATAASASAALTAGGTAFTKRVETALLAEPNTLAKAVARLNYARELKVQEVRGGWVRVSAGRSSGWVFAGNLAEEKPSETAGLDGLPLPASETTATAAARPLAPATEEYAQRQGKSQAAEQLRWLETQARAVRSEDVETFLREQKKGEFQ